MKKLSLLFVLTITFTSCFKTAEEIRREKMIDDQLAQSSRIIADLTSQVHELKGGLATTSGQLEEIDYKTTTSSQSQYATLQATVNQLTAQVKILNEENQQTQKEVRVLRSEINAQKSYIKKVTGTLSSMGGGSSSKKGSGSLLQKAHKAFESNKQKQAQKLYLEVLSEGKISNAQKNHVYFNLGLLDYWKKKYNEALVYFSKIYTKYPKSSFAPASLLYIARSFGKQGKKEEANATYQELIKNYPKSKHAKSAKKELK